MDSKTRWRRTILAKRRQLDPQFILEASQRIAQRLFSLEEFQLAERIALYASFRGEVETEPIFQKSHAMRKELFYPAVDEARQAVSFYRVQNLKELAPGYKGILEPVKRTHPLGKLNFLNMIVVPGVVFDVKGNRIGFGLGFYDRLLEKFKGVRAALAFDFQVCDLLPIHNKDQRMDIIVTEERIIKII